MIARLGGAFGRNVVLAVTVVFFGLPVVWLLLAPTKTSATLAAEPLAFGSVAQVGSAWEHLLGYQDGVIGDWIVNSAVYSAASVVLVLLTAVPAGYALAVGRFRGRETLLVLTLITMIVPSAALILPLYLEMAAVGLTNTALSVILPLGFYPFGVYLVFLFTANTLPLSIVEAARVDGCSEWGILLRIFLPPARPVVVVVAFFAFVNSWNSYFLPFIMLVDVDAATLQTGLQVLAGSTGAVSGVNFTGIPIREPELALAAVVSIAPILLIFLFAQRYLAAGHTVGAEKG